MAPSVVCDVNQAATRWGLDHVRDGATRGSEAGGLGTRGAAASGRIRAGLERQMQREHDGRRQARGRLQQARWFRAGSRSSRRARGRRWASCVCSCAAMACGQASRPQRRIDGAWPLPARMHICTPHVRTLAPAPAPAPAPVHTPVNSQQHSWPWPPRRARSGPDELRISVPRQPGAAAIASGCRPPPRPGRRRLPMQRAVTTTGTVGAHFP